MEKNDQGLWASGVGSNIQSFMVATFHLVCLFIVAGPGIPEPTAMNPFSGVSLIVWQTATFITGLGLIPSTFRLNVGHVVVLVAGFLGEAYFQFGAMLQTNLTSIQTIILCEIVLIVIGYFLVLKSQQKRFERQAAFLRKVLELRKSSGGQS